jgi:hypothetical protein
LRMVPNSLMIFSYSNGLQHGDYKNYIAPRDRISFSLVR